MKYKKIILVIILVCTQLLCAHNLLSYASEKYVNQKYGFEVLIPESWVVIKGKTDIPQFKDTDNEMYSILCRDPKTEGGISIEIIRNKNRNISEGELFNEAVQQKMKDNLQSTLSQIFDEVNYLGVDDLSLQGKQAKGYVFVGSFQVNSTSKILITFIVTAHKGNIFNISYMITKEQLESGIDDYNDFIKSVRFF